MLRFEEEMQRSDMKFSREAARLDAETEGAKLASTTCTLKTEQRKDKQGNRRKFRSNCGTFRVTISKKSYMSLHNSENQKLSRSKTKVLFRRGAATKRYGVFAGGRRPDAETERAESAATKVKLKRAQGECLGIRSRRRT